MLEALRELILYSVKGFGLWLSNIATATTLVIELLILVGEFGRRFVWVTSRVTR